MRITVVSLDERRQFGHADLERLKARVARFEAALRTIILRPDDAFIIAASVMSEDQ